MPCVPPAPTSPVICLMLHGMSNTTLYRDDLPCPGLTAVACNEARAARVTTRPSTEQDYVYEPAAVRDVVRVGPGCGEGGWCCRGECRPHQLIANADLGYRCIANRDELHRTQASQQSKLSRVPAVLDCAPLLIGESGALGSVIDSGVGLVIRGESVVQSDCCQPVFGVTADSSAHSLSPL